MHRQASHHLGRGALLAVLLAGALFAVPRSEAASTIRVASGLNRPIYVCAPQGDPRLFIVEQRGVIKILEDGAVLGTPFLDIDALIPNISGNDERGLLGLAFPPDYASTGYFFVYYYSNAAHNIVARYQVSANPDVANAASAQIVLDITDFAENHNGGCMHFGPDGYLWIGTGDGGGAGDTGNLAQNKLSTFGKMLRIDVSSLPYVVPADNPFVGNPAYLPEIWALGLRNPWRWSFDRLTGDIWIGDVGQNNWEEIDFESGASSGGLNFGWRLTEGNVCYNPSMNCDDGDPVITYPELVYSHAVGFSVTGGYVYRGGNPELQGRYFYSDFGTSFIKSFVYSGGAPTDQQDHTAEFAPGGGLTISSIASYGEDGYGELYIVDRGGTTTGEIYMIVPESTSVPSDPTRQGLLLSPARPNPFTGTTEFQLVLEESGTVDLSVYDIAGRIVREMPIPLSSAGVRHVSWDGRDASGRALPAGVYWVRAAGARGAATQSVQLVR